MRTNHLRLSRIAIPVAIAAFGLAACGGHNSAGANTGSSTSAVVMVAKNAHLGQILVDGKGRSIYLFVKDTGTASTCSGGCASLWPPVLTSAAPTAGSGATASLVGTTTRSDGQKQVTYNGHPLYYYVADKTGGQITGQGLNQFGALWWALNPQGNQITASGS